VVGAPGKLTLLWQAGALLLLAPPAPSQVLRLTEPQEIELGRRAAAEVEFHQPLLDDSRVSD
jgi:hypothetical protein